MKLCSFCGCVGHNVRTCEIATISRVMLDTPTPKPTTTKSKKQRRCKTCGEVGHYSKKCPERVCTVVTKTTGFTRPRGRAPKGSMWNTETGKWMKEESKFTKEHKPRSLGWTNTITKKNTIVEVIDKPLPIGCNGYITPGLAYCISAAVDLKLVEQFQRKATASELEAAYREVWP